MKISDFAPLACALACVGIGCSVAAAPLNEVYLDGVFGQPSFGAAPTPVPRDVFAALAQRCDGRGKLIPSPPLQSGDRVVMPCGPFAEFVATVDRIDPDRRVWILLDMMGGKTRVAVPPDQVRAV